MGISWKGTLAAPSAWEGHADGKQVYIPKLKVKLFNGAISQTISLRGLFLSSFLSPTPPPLPNVKLSKG
jgi:hypothetical protein